jgi:hypothetical protein
MTTSDYTGPWLTADYLRFGELCDYGYIADEFRKNSVYQWLFKHVPSAVPANPPYTRMHIVARYIVVAGQPNAFGGLRVTAPAEVARARKWHNKAQTQIKRLQKTLGNRPYLLLPRLDDELARALSLLDTRSTRAKQPWLLKLACELVTETNSVEPELLSQLATALNLIDFEQRTAQRYVKEAEEPRSDR